MVALVASLSALALLGIVTRAPAWFGGDDGFSTVSPGLLKVAPEAKGVATLGGGVSVSLYRDGLRVMRGDDMLLQTVIRGSMLSAVEGSTEVTDDGPVEHVRRQFDNLRITELVFLPGRATYFGEVFDSKGARPITIRVELAGSVIRVGAVVNGVDAIVWHLDHEPRTLGLRPALPSGDLAGSAVWIDPATIDGRAAFSTSLGTDIGAGPQRARRGVDLRSPGRVDVHIWADDGFLTVSSQARPQVKAAP